MNVSIFPTPLLYASWGFRNGGDAWNDAASLAAHCKAHGFKTVAVEWGTMLDGAGDTVETTTRADVEVLQQAGLEVIGWNVAGPGIVAILNDLGVTGVHCQVEGPSQYDGALAAFQEMHASGWPGKKAIVTTYWGLLTNESPTSVGARYAALQGLGCKEAWIECYAGDNPNTANLDGMMQHGVDIGMPREVQFPLCGSYRGELPANYTGLESRAPHFGVYLAEPMSESQWTAWGEVKPIVSQVYFWQVIAKPTGRVMHEERAITYASGDDGLSRTLKWCAANKPSLRLTNDIEIKRVLHAAS